MPFIVQPKRVFTISPVEPIKHNQKNHAKNQLMVQARTTAAPTQRNESRLSQIRQLATVENVRSWFTQNMRNYCETTSLHGLNYIVRSDISRRERLFWVGVILISIITSIVLVIVSWHWNSETPTVTVIESSHFPTWNIPFPAITICNFNKISKKNALLLAKKMKRPSNVSETDLLNLFHITMYFSFALDYTEMDYELFEEILNENNFTVRELTEKLTPDCMDTISKCIWKGTNSRCDALFQRINTTEGVCCAFNYFGQTSSNFPEKIAYQVPKRPYRVTGCGYPTGLSVLLDPNAEDYFGTYFSSFGFRLLIHDAYNFPDENAETKVVTSMRESFVRINPESTYATSDVENMNPITRNCLFSSEHRLSVMQRYSFINCMSECRIQMLYERCGCIPINLPNNGSYPICGLRRIFCITQSREIFIRALPTIEESLSVVRNNEVFPCNCMPDCEANRYPSEITMGRLSEGNNDIKTNRTNNNEKNNVLLHVFFSDLMSTRYRMEIFQNWLSSLASFGGLLGLIMGFSIVTAFEFFYFLTFRPIFNYFNDA